MNFSTVIMNPPYGKTSAPAILNKCIEVGGHIVSIQPCEFFTEPTTHLSKKSNSGEYGKLVKNLNKHLQDIDVIPEVEADRLFKISARQDLAIFDIDTTKKSKITQDRFQTKDPILLKILKKSYSMRSIRSVSREHRLDKNDPKVVIVRRTNHGYLPWTEKDNNFPSVDGIKFRTEKEAINFRKSLRDTWFYKFLNKHPDFKRARELAHVPFFEDYTKPWTNERFYRYFNISNDEQKIIEDCVKENNL